MSDPFNLDRFVVAQEKIYSAVVEELKAGIKMSHWMWCIFPQVESLGRTAIAKMYGIKSLDEAKAYVPIRYWARDCKSVQIWYWPLTGNQQTIFSGILMISSSSHQ